MTVVVESSRVRAEIDPERGARLVSLTFDGLEVIGHADDVAEATETLGTGSYPMVPWAGRVHGLDMHGTGKDAVWEHDGDGRFHVDLPGDPWPDRGIATLDYQVADDALTATLEWDSAGDYGCSLGFHPWFRRQVDGVEVEADITPLRMAERGADHLPTGRIVDPAPLPWDDCFQLAAPPRLTWPGILAIELTTDAGWWVVYTEPTGAICVEPQTAPPDAWNHPALKPAVWPTSVSLTIRAC